MHYNRCCNRAYSNYKFTNNLVKYQKQNKENSTDDHLNKFLNVILAPFFIYLAIAYKQQQKKKTSVALSPRANYTD
jgi:hypothetical protein